MKDNNPNKSEHTNTVRISAIDLIRLEQEMTARKGGDVRRTFIRMPFQKHAITIEVAQPGGMKSSLRYAVRNLSSTGIGFLHSSFIHNGTLCTVHLPDLEGNIHPTMAKVVRCQHFKGIVHEIGLLFLKPINIRDFIPMDLMDGGFAMEAVKCEKLTGAVLHVDDSAIDRRLVRHYLRDTNLNVVNAEDGAGALARAAEPFDIVLCEQDLPDMTGVQLIESLRAKGIQTPIIITTGDAKMAVRQEARDAKASAYLNKPFSQEALLRAIAEFLLMDTSDSDSGGPLYSSLQPTDSAFGFVPEFAEELRRSVTKLNSAMDADDLSVVKRTCAQIRGAAKGMGFASLGAAADATLIALQTATSVKDAAKPLRSLIGMCVRVRFRDPSKKAG